MLNRMEIPDDPGLTFPNRQQVIESLARMRLEWQEAAEGESLIEVTSSVGLVLADVINLIGLSQQEKIAVLGSKLSNELAAILEDFRPM